MEDRFQQKPALLTLSAGTKSCHIFRAPKSQEESNPNAYKPRIVSIGPYHHGKKRLELIEQHKPRAFSKLLDRTAVGPIDYFNAIASWETHIRDSYSEALHWKTSDLIEMMILDACFMIELFRAHTCENPEDADDPVFFTPWILSSLMIDLLLIENQIPFFVLRKIYALSKSSSDADRSLNEIALRFFNRALQWIDEHLQKHYRVSKITHLLDLFRLCLVGHLNIESPPPVDKELLQLMPSTNHMLLAGIKFESRKSKNLIDVVFDDGVLRIPPFTIDLFTSSFFLSCLAYEQCCHCCSKHISSYVVFMRCIMGTAADAVFSSLLR
ncbi:hypothetical protein EUGRSUZ_A00660 [Eucalyptus grandis]|uniref:Uncharacterized protein n=2 Tax=Eucalyptus grandis TaxID=71139 RepID=A0ACC3M0X3_EUCGR|nr:hypothetical protein EUGRSUZ_A00660 [Eucalyptus grandis]